MFLREWKRGKYGSCIYIYLVINVKYSSHLIFLASERERGKKREGLEHLILLFEIHV